MFGANASNWPLAAGTARVFRATLACAFAAAISTSASAAPGNSHTLQGTANGEVLNPMTIAKVEDMDFGSIAATATPGTVVLNPANSACTKTGALVLSGTCQAAVFDGYGSFLQVLRIQVANSIQLTGSNGGSMQLNNFTLNTTPDLLYIGGNGNGVGNGNRRYAILRLSGLFNFRVGGTLNVGANQTPGAYTGTFDVTVRYQ